MAVSTLDWVGGSNRGVSQDGCHHVIVLFSVWMRDDVLDEVEYLSGVQGGAERLEGLGDQVALISGDTWWC